MRSLYKIAAPVGIAAILVSVLAIGFGSQSIDAARGGNGKAVGHANGGSTTATLYAEPNPADEGSVVRVKGCGFHNDRQAEVHIEHNGTTEAYGVWVWADGCIDFPYQTAEPGIYGLEAFQQSRHRMTLVAEGTLEVQ
jgi:hypothetical protein